MPNDIPAELIETLQRPEIYPHPVDSITMRETHISLVFLTGNFVYKLKKPVNLDFLDFTTLEKRKHFCRQEVELNRRLTSDIYLDVVPITRDGGRISLGGAGRTLEYAVKMRQLDDTQTMDQMLLEEKIDHSRIEQLAAVLAGFYAAARTGQDVDRGGSWATIRANCEENFVQTEEFKGTLLNPRHYLLIRAATRSFLHRRGDLFERRIAEGRIREGHGDLRTDHIYFTAEGIQILDCIEFNERFRYGDVASDLAFLAMDLDFRQHPQVALELLKIFVHRTRDEDLFVLLDFYKCYRAFVRVKVNCMRVKLGDVTEQQRAELLNATQRYMQLAYEYAGQFTRPTLWVVCGMVATGKSTVAGSMAEHLNIALLRTDAIRKELFPQLSERQTVPEFKEGAYSDAATAMTYDRMFALAQKELDKESSVVLDATFSRRRYRRDALRLAQDMDANIIFIECRCSEVLLKERLKRRDATDTLSDARLKHFEQIRSDFEDLKEIPPNAYLSIDTAKPLQDNIEEILSACDLVPAAQEVSVKDSGE